MADDIYSTENTRNDHYFRYILIKAKNVVGMLNRISTVFRRKRYNIEDIGVAFDEQGFVQIVVAIDSQLLNVQQIIHHLEKLHDIIEIYDATHQKDRLHNAIFVQSKTHTDKEFESFPIAPSQVIHDEDGAKGIFTLSLEQTKDFIDFLSKNEYHFKRRFFSFIV